MTPPGSLKPISMVPQSLRRLPLSITSFQAIAWNTNVEVVNVVVLDPKGKHLAMQRWSFGKSAWELQFKVILIIHRCHQILDTLAKIPTLPLEVQGKTKMGLFSTTVSDKQQTVAKRVESCCQVCLWHHEKRCSNRTYLAYMAYLHLPEVSQGILLGLLQVETSLALWLRMLSATCGNYVPCASDNGRIQMRPAGIIWDTSMVGRAESIPVTDSTQQNMRHRVEGLETSSRF